MDIKTRKWILKAASNDETRPMLTVPFWTTIGGETYLVASDGSRLHAALDPSGIPGGYAGPNPQGGKAPNLSGILPPPSVPWTIDKGRWADASRITGSKACVRVREGATRELIATPACSWEDFGADFAVFSPTSLKAALSGWGREVLDVQITDGCAPLVLRAGGKLALVMPIKAR